MEWKLASDPAAPGCSTPLLKVNDEGILYFEQLDNEGDFRKYVKG